MRLFLFCFLLVPISLYSQDLDLLDEEPQKEETHYSYATFKTNRIINGHSVEMVKKRNFDLKISHRFGYMDQGFYDLFGLDLASIRIGGDYGLTDRINVGVGRSSVKKTYDGYIKWNLLKQSTGAKNMPVSAVWMSHVGVHSLRTPSFRREFNNRLYYVNQLLLARKFSDGFSLQLTPTHIHKNLVDSAHFSNDVFVLGIGMRQRLTRRTSVNLEYFHTLYGELSRQHVNALSLGFDVETGGHVFQLFFSNAFAPYEEGFILGQNGKWTDAEFRFGFNIARMFTF